MIVVKTICKKVDPFEEVAVKRFSASNTLPFKPKHQCKNNPLISWSVCYLHPCLMFGFKTICKKVGFLKT